MKIYTYISKRSDDLSTDIKNFVSREQARVHLKTEVEGAYDMPWDAIPDECSYDLSGGDIFTEDKVYYHEDGVEAVWEIIETTLEDDAPKSEHEELSIDFPVASIVAKKWGAEEALPGIEVVRRDKEGNEETVTDVRYHHDGDYITIHVGTITETDIQHDKANTSIITVKPNGTVELGTDSIRVPLDEGSLAVTKSGTIYGHPGVLVSYKNNGEEELAAAVKYDTDAGEVHIVTYKEGEDTPTHIFKLDGTQIY